MKSTASRILDNILVFIRRKTLQINGRTVDVMCYEPLDKELVLKAVEEIGKIVTVEEGYLAGDWAAVLPNCL